MLAQAVWTAWLRVKALIFRRRLDRDLEEELSLHMALRAEKLAAEGMPQDAARAAAQRRFGNATRVCESCRDLWTFAALESLWHDVRYGLRTLAKSPAFSAVAVVSLALGIGANTALFSLMDVMLLRTLPVKDSQHLVEFIRVNPPSMMGNIPYPVFSYLAQDRQVLADVFAVDSSEIVLNAGGGPEMAQAHLVSGSFFPAVGVPALVGRTMGPGDGRHRVAVLSFGFWIRRFAQNAAIIGSTVRVDGDPLTVIGVMPPGFFGIDRLRVPDLWLPMPADARPPSEVWIAGHLKPGVSVLQARAALEPRFRQALQSFSGGIASWPERDRERFLSQRLLIRDASSGTADLRWTYWDGSFSLKVLIGLTGLVLLIACANLANLLMARSQNRAREIAIRLGIGAGRLRLIRQLLTENLLLSLFGGIIGVLAAGWGHRILLGFLIRDPQSVALDFRLDYRVLWFSVALSVATCLLFGLLPSVRATRPDLISAMRPQGRQRHSGGIPFARMLLPVQIALSMVLLVGAGLFSRSLTNLRAAGLGLDRENVLLADVRAPGKTAQENRQFWTRVIERISVLPGVRSAALGGDAVFGNGGWNQTVWIQHPGQPDQHVNVSHNVVSPGFFATVGIPVLVGREFTERDNDGAPLVALVNQTFARRYFGSENPIGRRFGDRGRGSGGRYEIVGVVGDAKYGSVREKTRAMVFQPLLQETPRGSLVLHLRGWERPAPLAKSIRREMLAIDGNALMSDVRTLPQVIHIQLRQDRMLAMLGSFFAALALALAAIGIYGVVAYGVAHRTSEIGVRIALGAQRADVLSLVMKETLVLVAIGGILGTASALAVSSVIRKMLFGLRPSDPATLVIAGVVLLTAGILACVVPARRAASLDPVDALRAE